MGSQFSIRNWLVGTVLGMVLFLLTGIFFFTDVGYQLLVYPPTKLGLFKTVADTEIIPLQPQTQPIVQQLAEGQYHLWTPSPAPKTDEIQIRSVESGHIVRLGWGSRAKDERIDSVLAFTFTIETDGSYEISTAASNDKLFITPSYGTRNLIVLIAFYLLPSVCIGLAFWQKERIEDRKQREQKKRYLQQWDTLIQEMSQETGSK